MGFFDIFKSKNTDASQSIGKRQRSIWSKKLAKYDRNGASKKNVLSEEFLLDLGTHFENPRIEKDTPMEQFELRARFNGNPIKVCFDPQWCVVDINYKCENKLGSVNLDWDLEKIPKKKYSGDDWNENDDIRVFIGNGVFIEGREDDVDNQLSVLEHLPENFVTNLVGNMQNMKLPWVKLNHDDLFFRCGNHLYEMTDPIEEIMTHVTLLKSMSEIVMQAGEQHASTEKVEQDIDQQVNMNRTISTSKERCQYCSTIFLLNASSKCPNCGASFGA